MADMEWDDSFSVGNEKLDSQHKELIDLVNLLNEEDMTGLALERLKSYAREHFRDEEALLESSGNADLDIRKAQHRNLEAWLAQTHRSYITGNGSRTMREGAQEYLKRWLTEHIISSGTA